MENSLFSDNIGLARNSASHWFNKTPLDYDDCYQLALFGLYKASKTFRPDGGALFQTWAITHMNNEVKNELRRLQRRVPETLLPPTASEREEENGREHSMDQFGDIDQSLDNIEDSASLHKIINYIKNLLTEREWKILWMIAVEDAEQKKVAEMFGFQQPHTSRIMKGIKRKITNNPELLLMVSNYFQSDEDITMEAYMRRKYNDVSRITNP